MKPHQDAKAEDLLQKYRTDLNFYAKSCLTIRDKGGNVERFPGFNAAQKQVHRRLQEQLVQTGKVRALILKGRQQGISSYIAARFYRRATLFRGTGVYILTHEQAASDNLFKMVERFQIHNPIAPKTGTENAKELEFNELDSSYVVATAGQKAGGRGRTITLFHGSEIAFWQSAKDHFASSVQTVPDMPGTEIILESTGYGAQGEFYERWQKAIQYEGDYIPIFVPWYIQEEYSRAVGHDFELNKEVGETGISEEEYAKLFNLSNEQMAWYRAKVAELGKQKFDQEYPGSEELAFASADLERTLILPIQVLRARRRGRGPGEVPIEGAGPLIIGADPSGPGKDKFAVAARQGLKVLWTEERALPVTLEAAYWIKALIDTHDPERLNMDLGNIGHAVWSLVQGFGDGYAAIVKGVNFGDPSQFKRAYKNLPGPKNRRAEMWDRVRQWLELEEGVSLPDDPIIQTQLTAPRKKPVISGDFLLESKDQMRSRGVHSPDTGDAIALTFADSSDILQFQTRASVDKKIRESAPRLVTALDPAPAAATFAGDFYAGPNSWMGY